MRFGPRDMTWDEWWGSTRLAYWWGLPWRCKMRHRPVRREHFNWDACAVEEVWVECERCGNWLGHHPDDPTSRAVARRRKELADA